MSATYGQPGTWRSLLGVLVLHGVVLAVLLTMTPMAEVVGLPQPLMVSLLPAPEAEPEEIPKPLPPKPQVQPRTPQPPPVLVAREEAPTPLVAPAPPPEPVPLPVVLPEPTPVPEPVRPVPQAAAPVAPPAVVPPRFDADYLDNPAPVYPPLSRRLGEQGQVLLRVYVNAEGGAAQVEIRESSGFERLDKAALNTVRRWRFVPARQGDRGVAAWVLVPISFSIRS
ncbi:MAG TPA: TonB family protein [Thiobacillaceae bacterium]|nr:TonB family protein [Thiobacillaceae bacterium]HNU64180.1 TonB family protein [Thiobacillaceae bacterium]